MENLEKGFYNGKNDHTALWTTLQRLMPQWKDKEYTDFPRGRVLFDAMEEVFLVYSSQVIRSQRSSSAGASEKSSRPARTAFIRRATSNGGRPCARSCSKEIPCSFSASGSQTGFISQCSGGLTRWLSDWIPPLDVSMKAQPISMGKPPMQDASQS